MTSGGELPRMQFVERRLVHELLPASECAAIVVLVPKYPNGWY